LSRARSLFQSRGGIVDIRGMDLAVDGRPSGRVGRSRFASARLPIVVGVGSLLVFTAVQTVLEYRIFFRQQRDWVSGRFPPGAFAPAVRAVLEHPSRLPVWLRFPYGVGWELSSLVRFAALMAVTTAVAAWGWRWSFWIPAALWAMGPWLFGLPDGAFSGGAFTPPPFTLSLYWPDSIVWLGVALEVTLICLPGTVVALGQGSAATSVRRDRALAAGAFVLCAATFILWQSTRAAASGNAGATWTTDLARVLPPFALGVLLPVSRRRWPVLVGAVAFFWWFWQAQVVVVLPIRLVPLSVFLTGLAPFAFAVFLGAAWRPLADGLKRLEGRPWALFWIANGLNVADAVITWSFLRSGQIQEANPFVRGIGLPAKVILVGLLTWLLVRARPRALVWPILVLAFVMAWDVAGILLSRAMGVG